MDGRKSSELCMLSPQTLRCKAKNLKALASFYALALESNHRSWRKMTEKKERKRGRFRPHQPREECFLEGNKASWSTDNGAHESVDRGGHIERREPIFEKSESILEDGKMLYKKRPPKLIFRKKGEYDQLKLPSVFCASLQAAEWQLDWRLAFFLASVFSLYFGDTHSVWVMKWPPTSFWATLIPIYTLTPNIMVP